MSEELGSKTRLHWARGATFGEDASQVRTGNSAHTVAGMRNLAISLHRFAAPPNIAKALPRRRT